MASMARDGRSEREPSVLTCSQCTLSYPADYYGRRPPYAPALTYGGRARAVLGPAVLRRTEDHAADARAGRTHATRRIPLSPPPPRGGASRPPPPPPPPPPGPKASGRRVLLPGPVLCDGSRDRARQPLWQLCRPGVRPRGLQRLLRGPPLPHMRAPPSRSSPASGPCGMSGPQRQRSGPVRAPLPSAHAGAFPTFVSRVRAGRGPEGSGARGAAGGAGRPHGGSAPGPLGSVTTCPTHARIAPPTLPRPPGTRGVAVGLPCRTAPRAAMRRSRALWPSGEIRCARARCMWFQPCFFYTACATRCARPHSSGVGRLAQPAGFALRLQQREDVAPADGAAGAARSAPACLAAACLNACSAKVC